LIAEARSSGRHEPGIRAAFALGLDEDDEEGVTRLALGTDAGHDIQVMRPSFQLGEELLGEEVLGPKSVKSSSAATSGEAFENRGGNA
jgi:hypothetical protein